MFRKKRIWMVVSVLLIFSLGCSVFGLQLPPGSGQGAAESETVSQDSGGEADEEELPSLPEPNPINVRITTEEDASAGATAHPGEDTIFSATDSRGIVYTLKIPDGALLSSEEIRMTPVSEMEGLPEGVSMAAAVHLAPEGLVFLKSATLAIELPEDMSAQDLYALSTMANGEDAHMTPFRQVGQQFIVPIHHFSSPSLMKMGQEAMKRVKQDHSPSNIGRSVMHNVSDEVDLDNPEDANRETIYNYILKWHRDGLLPLIERAQVDAEFFEEAAVEYLLWHNTLVDLQHADIIDREFALALISNTQLELALAYIKTYEVLAERCRKDNDPVQAARMIRYLHMMNFLRLAEDVLDAGFSKERHKELIVGCVNFLMHFESSFEIETEKGKWHMQVTDLNAQFKPTSGDFYDVENQVYTLNTTAESDLNYIELSVDPDSDKCTYWGESGTVKYQLKLDANLNYMDFPDSVRLTMKIPELPKEMWDCSDPLPPNAVPSWIAAFWAKHADRANVGHKGPYQFKVPIIYDCSAGACEYAKQKWPVGEDNPQVDGYTEITIIHTPE